MKEREGEKLNFEVCLTRLSFIKVTTSVTHASIYSLGSFLENTRHIYKEKWTQPWPMGSKIYLDVHENPRAFVLHLWPNLLGVFYPMPIGV